MKFQNLKTGSNFVHKRYPFANAIAYMLHTSQYLTKSSLRQPRITSTQEHSKGGFRGGAWGAEAPPPSKILQ